MTHSAPTYNLGGSLLYLIWEKDQPAYFVRAKSRDDVEAGLELGCLPFRELPSILRVADSDDPVLRFFELDAPQEVTQ